jgi:8-oxo-dGTP pyrophosphatase MutT (NUDIX family)
MEQLGNLIVSNNLHNQTRQKYRLAARGIILKDDKILMIYSRFYNDYTFPGGGVENGEDEILALKRECVEEAGVEVENVRPFCKIFEKRELDEETFLLHESHFYLCDISKFTERHLEDYEIALGYETVWLSIDDAIKSDEKKMQILTEKDYKGVLERELLVLKKLKKITSVN